MHNLSSITLSLRHQHRRTIFRHPTILSRRRSTRTLVFIRHTVSLFRRFFRTTLRPHPHNTHHILLTSNQRRTRARQHARTVTSRTRLFGPQVRHRPVLSQHQNSMFTFTNLRSFLRTPNRTRITLDILLAFITNTRGTINDSNINNFLQFLRVTRRNHTTTRRRLTNLNGPRFGIQA